MSLNGAVVDVGICFARVLDFAFGSLVMLSTGSL